MDLSRGVETLIFPNRRIGSVDYSSDGSFILYSAMAPQTDQEDLFFSQPNGQNEQNLTSSVAFRERHARIDPFSSTAVYEGIDESGVSRIYLFAQTPLTRGPAPGEPLPDTPYVVGGDADPVFSPDGQSIAFRRLTGVGNGGLGTWDLLTLRLDGTSDPKPVVTGPLCRSAPDWGSRGIVYVETDAAAAESRLVLVQPDGSGHTVLRTEDAGFRMGSPRWLAGS
jgi:Tol biopolymer transport system component